MKTVTLLVAACLALCAAPTARGAQRPAEQSADAAFAARDWDGAARAYDALTRLDPANGTLWFKLGSSLHELGRYGEAAESFLKSESAAANPQRPAVARLRVARAYARLGDRERAFEWLEKALDAGLAQFQALAAEPDLEPLRADARFAAAVARAEANAYPCRSAAEHRRFDFWVGEWDVYVGDRIAGQSRVERIVQGCVVFENWTSTSPFEGKSFNFYDASAKRWRQLWLDSAGSVLELSGDFVDGAMRFTGVTAGAGGAKTLHRLTFTPLEGGKVRQHWQQSRDGGATWADAFDGTYVPRTKS